MKDGIRGKYGEDDWVRGCDRLEGDDLSVENWGG